MRAQPATNCGAGNRTGRAGLMRTVQSCLDSSVEAAPGDVLSRRAWARFPQAAQPAGPSLGSAVTFFVELAGYDCGNARIDRH